MKRLVLVGAVLVLTLATSLAAAQANSARSGAHLDAATAKYLKVLTTNYKPLPGLYRLAIQSCGSMVSDVAACKQHDSDMAAKTQSMLTALKKVAVPAKLKSAHKQFVAAFKEYLAGIKSEIASINDSTKYTAAYNAVMLGLADIAVAVSTMNTKLPQAKLQVLSV